MSVRVKKELKREAKRLKLGVKSTLENALIAALKQEKKKRLEKTVNDLLLEMDKVSGSNWIKAVNECRNNEDDKGYAVLKNH